MDDRTRAFYAHYANDLAGEAARSAMSRHFEAAFAPGTRILDVGCGSGRDLAALHAMGFDAWAVEPSAAMRAVAASRHPALAGRVVDAALPRLGEPFGGAFDGVVCSAVLMHLRADELAAALRALRAVLAPRGRLLLSVPALGDDQLRDGRDRDGRLFTSHAPESLQSQLLAIGLDCLDRWELVAGTGASATRWTTLLFGCR
jgi:SAM-dependent methyltransferase